MESMGGLPIEAEPYRITDLALEMVWVIPGRFSMGSPVTEAGRDRAEGPQTKVVISRGFWLGQTEVTQAQYEAVAGENPSAFVDAGPNAPVEHVSWIMAMAYCRELTEREKAAGRLPEGFEYPLPTEAEWEYVYRAGTTNEYVGSPPKMGWIESNSMGTTHPVGLKERSAGGFYDMAGNVREWCYDWHGDYPGGKVSDPVGPKRGHHRMARGGCWRMDGEITRCAARAGGSAGRVDYTLGFRIALHAKR
jgi:formylglycine-generating enzyme required for sulfatase activity